MKKVLVCASLLALSVSAFASDATGVYVRGDIGASKTNFSAKSLKSIKSKVSPSYNVGVGYKFDDNLRADANLKLLKSKMKTGEAKHKVAFVNGYYDFKNESIFTPYVTAGLGMTHNTSKTLAHKHNQFAWNAGLGSKINMSKNVDLDVAYKYSKLGKIEKARIHAHELLAGVVYNF